MNKGKVYALSDTHGNKILYNKVMNYLKPDDKVYFLGDAIDRGDYGWPILCSLLLDERFTCLRGNHEDMLLKAYATFEEDLVYNYNYELMLWFRNGGNVTLEAMLNMNNPNAVRSIMARVNKLPLEVKYINPDGKEIYMTHSGATSLDEECYTDMEHEMIWNRSHFGVKWLDGDNKYVVHGHTPVPYLIEELRNIYKFIHEESADWLDNVQEDEPLFYCEGHKIDIDCGAHFQGVTALLNLDTFETITFKEND